MKDCKFRFLKHLNLLLAAENSRGGGGGVAHTQCKLSTHLSGSVLVYTVCIVFVLSDDNYLGMCDSVLITCIDNTSN
jgi:hypothetical protein